MLRRVSLVGDQVEELSRQCKSTSDGLGYSGRGAFPLLLFVVLRLLLRKREAEEEEAGEKVDDAVEGKTQAEYSGEMCLASDERGISGE